MFRKNLVILQKKNWEIFIEEWKSKKKKWKKKTLEEGKPRSINNIAYNLYKLNSISSMAETICIINAVVPVL